MYRVYCDGLTIYNDRLENLKILNPAVELEENKTGSFTFGLLPDHPHYGLIKKLKSIITVYQDDYLLFRGRVLDDTIGWHNQTTVTCEGELSFLLDSIQRPYDYSGTVAGFLNLLITRHNEQVEESKRFTVGNVTVVDANGYIVRSNFDHTDTWTELQKKLVDMLGGYIVVRHEGEISYIDYLQDINLLSSQPITFGRNLLDLKRIRKGADIATAVIPLGAKLKDAEGKDTDTRLTIESVNNGLDYIVDEDAQAQYGKIVKTVIFDDVTEPQNLLTKGKAHLAQLVNLPETVELTAADLATVDTAFSSFHLGTQVKVTSKPHGIDQLFRVSKLSISLLNPAANKLTLGGLLDTFSSKTSRTIVHIPKDGKDGKDGVAGRDGADGKDGKDGKDGVGVSSITEQYYLSTSATALAGGTWGGTVPTWVDGRFMWTRSVIVYTNGTSSTTNPKCVTGAKGSAGTAGSPGANGQPGKDGISITTVDVMYYQSTSSTALAGGSWATTAPVWVDGRFFWEKTVVTYSDGTKDESTPVCITGQKGSTGATGSPGAKGDKGDTGSPGKDGVNGKDAAVQSLTAPGDTSYMWLDISQDPPLLKRYDPETAAWVIVNDTTAIIYNLEQNLEASITKTEQDITATVAEKYYLKDETDSLVSSISTQIEQTANSVEIQFETFRADIESVVTNTDAEFEEIRKYIRFVEGKILLGEVGNELELVIANDRISFLQDGAEVAYFSNRKLYVTDTQVTHSLQLGNFAFMPRANGNLSFKQI